jgi:flagellar protein FliJ
MARNFPLAGLLGLRRLEEDQAASALSAANRRHAALQARHGAVLRDLETSPVDVASAAALRAAAIARASSRSMLTDLSALTAVSEADAVQAQGDFQQARAATVGLEKLEDKHASRLAVEDLRAEQLVLDEIASGSWHRQKESVPR